VTIAGERRAPAANRETPIATVDADVHQGPFDRVAELGPYLSKTHRQRLADYGFGGGGQLYQMDGGFRGWRSDLDSLSGGIPPRSVGAVTWDPDTTRRQLLDAYAVEVAILTGGPLYAVQTATPDVDYATALCRAFNEWTRATWLASDRRFRHAIAINCGDPEAAAEEIDRLGDDAGVCAVMMPTGGLRPFGHRLYKPIHEACVRHRLPIVMHFIGGRSQVTSAAYPSYYIEARFARPLSYQVQIASFIFEGVFDRHPGLKLGLLESGFNWVPAYTWRLDARWEALREQTPWVKRRPSEYMLDNVRFSSQPLEDPDPKSALDTILEWMHADRTLMFSSDYPHFDWDSPEQVFLEQPVELRRRILGDNARATFRL
jgi:predicted TIM-barrel fold metal-dependent hydrolase